MNNKGFELGIQTIVVAILALLVLVVLGYVFTGQIGKGTKQYETFREGIAVDKCEQLFGTRLCRENCEQEKNPDGTVKVSFVQVNPPQGKEWTDCKQKNKPACCEPQE